MVNNFTYHNTNNYVQKCSNVGPYGSMEKIFFFSFRNYTFD